MLKNFLTHRSLIRYDENIGHLYVPNLKMRIYDSEKPYFIRTNQQGFRANENFTLKKKDTRARIVFFGDSFLAGSGVVNDKRFSDVIAGHLNVQTYNFGLAGSGVDQQYLIYKNIACHYEHDIVVIAPHLMDLIRNVQDKRVAIDGYSGASKAIPKPYFQLEDNQLVPHNIPVPREREFVSENTDVNRLIQPNHHLKKFFDHYVPTPLKANLLKLQWSKELDGYQSEAHPKWKLMRRLIEAMIDQAGHRPVLLAPLPYYLPAMNPNYRRLFRNIADEYPNVYFADVLERFKQERDPYQLYFKKDKHYSEYGHQLIAEVLCQTLQKQNLVEVNARSHSSTVKTHHQSAQQPTYILGISAFYHDAAAALIKDGKIVAAIQEERLSRCKNDPRFPLKAINYCLAWIIHEVFECHREKSLNHSRLKLSKKFVALLCHDTVRQ